MQHRINVKTENLYNEKRGKKMFRRKFQNIILRLMLVFAGIAICISSSIAATQYQWKNNGAIDVEVTSPADNTYLSINASQGVSGTASDLDCQKSKPDGGTWSNWYPIGDDVTSGTTSSDYHMWWTVSGDGNIREETKYGTSATYDAPGYLAGNNVRNVTITANADDFDRGNESPTNKGYKESAGSDSITLKVWQVPVTTKTSGSRSANNDSTGVLSTAQGGDTLGFVEHNSPTGCEGFYGKIELKGSVPSGVPAESGFVWKSEKLGFSRHKTTSSDPDWVTPYDSEHLGPIWEPDGPGSAWYDGNTDHNGTNVNEIFMLDGPGFGTGPDNNASISAGWISAEYNKDFQSYVEYGGVTVSNVKPWETYLTIVESGGVWTVDDPNHIP